MCFSFNRHNLVNNVNRQCRKHYLGVISMNDIFHCKESQCLFFTAMRYYRLKHDTLIPTTDHHINDKWNNDEVASLLELVISPVKLRGTKCRITVLVLTLQQQVCCSSH